MSEPTKLRLAAALQDAGCDDLAKQAATGGFDDYESPFAFPLIELVTRLEAVGTPAAKSLAEAVREGDYDGTKEEADAWFKREGKGMFGDMLG